MIIVDSQPDRGTTFKIQFPSAQPKEEQCGPACGPEIIPGNGEVVLVVDDEPEILFAMQGLLRHLRYRAETASNGKEGLEKYRRQKPDAVLMDINMPEMSGVTCIEEILNFDPAANIAVFSGYNQDVIENLSPEAKAAIKDFVPKPIGLEALSALLAKMLEKE